MRNGSVVTKVFQDSLKQENVYAATDSLMSFKRCRLIVNPMAYLSRKEVIVKNCVWKNRRFTLILTRTGSRLECNAGVC
ncbi:MAG: hypothetical protein ACLU4N_10550 [Butyricimonas faecihominis]